MGTKPVVAVVQAGGDAEGVEGRAEGVAPAFAVAEDVAVCDPLGIGDSLVAEGAGVVATGDALVSEADGVAVGAGTEGVRVVDGAMAEGDAAGGVVVAGSARRGSEGLQETTPARRTATAARTTGRARRWLVTPCILSWTV